MTDIGFIGLGTMGKPMAMRIIDAGYSLMVNDKNKGLADLLISKGATYSDSYCNLARNCNAIITMLPESHHVEQVVLGENGILKGAHPDMLYIDMSSVTPETSIKINKALIEKDADSLDAPVSGGPFGAENGSLSIMVGGKESAYKKALPILNVLGEKILHMGESGSGQTTKLCNQILIGLHIQAVSEAFVLAGKSGLDLHKVREALMGGVAYSKVLELHGQKMLDRSFDKPAFKLRLHRKDLAAALEAGRNIGVPLPSTAFVAQQMDASIARGNAELDHTTLLLVEEQLANINN